LKGWGTNHALGDCGDQLPILVDPSTRVVTDGRIIPSDGGVEVLSGGCITGLEALSELELNWCRMRGGEIEEN